MKVTLAQIRLKTGDFVFNFSRIANALEQAGGDLVVLPDIVSLGAKDLLLDETFQQELANLYERVARISEGKTVVLGDVVIKDNKVFQYQDGMFEGLEFLSENRYYPSSLRASKASVAIQKNCIYVNAVCQADANIYAGGSFAKNAAGEIVFQAPLCEEAIETIDFSVPLTPAPLPQGERGSAEQQIIDVTTFALREYCENTGFKKVILGLSGGIDSALSATLAVIALGADNVLGVLMPGMYSSEGSVNDALKLAQNLGIKTEKYPITPLFENFMDTVVHERRQDLAEENLQARLRMLILMFFANRDGRLMLSTGNKSESAMGYGTLYGDLAGGFNMIADLTKTRVYQVAQYINREREIIPRETIEKPPSAELHPGQKDSDSLPDYAVLDDIIEMYVEQNRPHEEIYAKHDKGLVDDVIKRIYRAQFKRSQGCLGVRLTERAFFSGVNLPVVQRYY
jgi:NAD+ synthase (glutamine-hydrolysing)